MTKPRWTSLRRGPVSIPGPEKGRASDPLFGDPDDVVLPPKLVIDAGVAKFKEMAKLHWPKSTESFQLVTFDLRNEQQLAMTLGLVYMAMYEADRR